MSDELKEVISLREKLKEAEANVAMLKELVGLAQHEFNAIRARDGAPQSIEWGPKGPMQIGLVSEEYWDELTNRLTEASEQS